MSSLSQYFRPDYVKMYKQAAQPPMDPSMMGGAMPPGGMPPMDPSMMGGAMPPGGMPPMDPSMMGGAMPPMDPSMMGGAMPPMDPSMMGGAMPPADPASTDPVAASGGGKVSAKQQKEDLMNNIQSCLDDIKDYTYNNLMILIRVANTLGVQIPAETLVAPPDGKNMDILSDPSAISAATSGTATQSLDGSAPTDMPPAEQSPSEVKMSMYNLLGVPSNHTKSYNVKRAMNYLLNQNKEHVSSTMNRWLNNR